MKKLFVFESVHYTIKADKLLKAFECDYQIIATPREISSDCGMSIEVDEKDVEKVKEYFEVHGLRFEVRDLNTKDTKTNNEGYKD